MDEIKIGQDVWFVHMTQVMSSKILLSKNGMLLVYIRDQHTWLSKEDIFPSREALAKHLFPEMF